MTFTRPDLAEHHRIDDRTRLDRACDGPRRGADVLSVAERLTGGFLTAADVAVIAGDGLTRLELLLVRCGGCRFLAPAQDVARLVELVTAGGESVRDVSVPAGRER